MTFKSDELDFLRQADLGRLATIQSDGTPQNSPVGFTYNEEFGTIDIAGYQMSKSQKFRNIARNDKVAFVVDDITSRDPWRVRCLRSAASQNRPRSPVALGAAGDELDSAIIRVTPHRIISFGIYDQSSESHQLVADIRDVAPHTAHCLSCRRGACPNGPRRAASSAALLPAWQIAGLSLAVLVGHVFDGSGALVFGLLAVGVIWSLHRLHAHALESGSTAELIASVPGRRPLGPSRFFNSWHTSSSAPTPPSVASMMLAWLSDPDGPGADWWGPALAVAAVAVAATLAGALPTRLLHPSPRCLRAGLLVYFYVALAVIAKVASGTAPVEPYIQIGASPAPTEWG